MLSLRFYKQLRPEGKQHNSEMSAVAQTFRGDAAHFQPTRAASPTACATSSCILKGVTNIGTYCRTWSASFHLSPAPLKSWKPQHDQIKPFGFKSSLGFNLHSGVQIFLGKSLLDKLQPKVTTYRIYMIPP